MSSHFRTIDIQRAGTGGHRRDIASCRSCGRRIVWCRTAAGKAIPFDEMPDVLEVAGDLETVSTEHVHWNTCVARQQVQRIAPAVARHRSLLEDA